MGIIIESDKLSKRVKDLLAAGSRPDVCIKTRGCRIGLPQAFYRASPDLTTILNDPNVLFVSYLDYGRYCEKEADGKNYVIDFMAKSVQDVLNNTSRDCSGSQQCPTCGGFPPAKGIVEQAVEGIYKLLTTNPAILACISVSGPACPLISILRQAGLSEDTINKIIAIWKGLSVAEIANQIEAACRALGIPPSICNSVALATWIVNNVSKSLETTPPSTPPYTPQLPGETGEQPTGRTAILEILIAGQTFTVTAQEYSDGSYRVSGWQSPLGVVSFSILFSTCQIGVSGGPFSVSFATGTKLGAQSCRFTLGGYDVIIRVKGSGILGLGGSDSENILIIGVIVFLAIVGIILIAGR